MAAVNQAFQSAPMGRRVIAPIVIAVVFVAGAVVFDATFVVTTMPPRTPLMAKVFVSLAPIVTLLLLVPIFLVERSRTSHFRIENDWLVLARKRYPLAGLVAIDRDREVMRWAVRLWGNGGLGSIRGRFWSKRNGKFDAFLTDTDHAVVLRWPDKVVAVSPADPEFFIFTARKAAGLR